jgi:organic hydroperoxide reductase OsmC/OhrA
VFKRRATVVGLAAAAVSDIWQDGARRASHARARTAGSTLARRGSEEDRVVQAYPHRYAVSADAEPAGTVRLAATDLPPLATAPPPQFGGPGGQWSPETLLVAAVVDCFVLTFRAIAAASKLSWQALSCDAEGVLDRVEGVTRFTALGLRARLRLPAGVDPERARRMLEKAERTCLVSNSLAFRPTLETDVTAAP